MSETLSESERPPRGMSGKKTRRSKKQEPGVSSKSPLTMLLSTTPGIQVLNLTQAAQLVGKSPRQVLRLEDDGHLPYRRRITQRLTGYFAHELEGLEVELVIVRDPRTLGRGQVAKKLSVNERTISRMVRVGELPAPDNGRWYEHTLDAWLLTRPQVRS